jgi:hypothetical protein
MAPRQHEGAVLKRGLEPPNKRLKLPARVD